MADLHKIAEAREAKRQLKALTIYIKRAPLLDLPASCHRVLIAVINETIQKQRRDTDELSKSGLAKLTGLPESTQDRAISNLKKSGWLAAKRIANGGATYTVTIPGKGPLFDFAGPGARTQKRKNPLRKRLKP